VLFERLDREIAPMREIYDQLIQDPARIEKTLKAGAEKARAIATPFTAALRHAVGLRSLDQMSGQKAAKAAKVAAPAFKQYREKDGLFYFKLVDVQGELLLQSAGFPAPRDAAQAIAQLQQQGEAGLTGLKDRLNLLADIAKVTDALRFFAQNSA
jgi:tryptophanyl-tRNA synthetase